MNSLHYSKIIILFSIFLLILNFSALDISVNAYTSSTSPSFQVSTSETRILVTSPVYDNNSHLYFVVETGILPNLSNPYIKLSYVNSLTGQEVFSTTYTFHQLVEYNSINSTQSGPESSVIKQLVNIGNNGTNGIDMLRRGYNPITSTISTFQNQIVHSIKISTLDNVFSLEVNIPEGSIYPNNVMVSEPGIYFTTNVQNFPFLSSNDSVSMDVHITTSISNTIDVLDSNNLYLYNEYNREMNSSFNVQNGFLSGLQFQMLSPGIRDIYSFFNFQNQNTNNLSLNCYAGNIVTNTNIFPATASLSQSNAIGTTPGGLQDFTINANMFNFQITGSQLALAAITLGALTGILAALYYFLRKYLLYIVGIVVTIGVTIYLPTRKVTAIQALHHEKRREIMDALHEVGGEGMLMKDLKDLIQLPQTTLLWHLDVLQEFEFITRVKIHKQIIIISNDFLDQFDPRVKELELSFQSEQGEKFKKFISSRQINESFTISEVVKKTNWHEKTTKRHLKRLAHLGIVIQVKNSNEYLVSPEFYEVFTKS